MYIILILILFCGVSAQDPPELFQFNQSTLQAFYFIQYAEIDGYQITYDDWIGAFNGDICVGARQWNGEFTDVPLMGDDGAVYTEGYMQTGDVPTFYFYDASSGNYYESVAVGQAIPPWENQITPFIDYLDLDELFIPEEHLLINTYPNPFNDTITIEIQIPASMNIEVGVYNILGECVEKLCNQEVQPGNLELNWNTVTSSSGVYFIHIFHEITDDQIKVAKSVKKITLLK